ncbi:MAG: hypothetical protein CME71_07060 [Halobacteriovorax sp.]|nr:hypothetical protein [Halobacteriovorax sp.]
MINKVIFLFLSICLSAQAGDGLGMGGGPPADILNQIIRPIIPIDSTLQGEANRLIFPQPVMVIDDAVLCKESESSWKPLLHTSEVLNRWPIDTEATCLDPLREFSQKLSLARAPLALSFATFIDGLEKHLAGTSLNWKNCTSGCVLKNVAPTACIEATPLLQKVTQIPSRSESFILNKAIWDEVSSKQPLVCAATVVDLWLSNHVPDKTKRMAMVSDFFSAKFHANEENVPRCFDPTASTRPFDSLDGQVQNILLQIN